MNCTANLRSRWSRCSIAGQSLCPGCANICGTLACLTDPQNRPGVPAHTCQKLLKLRNARLDRVIGQLGHAEKGRRVANISFELTLLIAFSPVLCSRKSISNSTFITSKICPIQRSKRFREYPSAAAPSFNHLSAHR